MDRNDREERKDEVNDSESEDSNEASVDPFKKIHKELR
jgi:hypothetical protein